MFDARKLGGKISVFGGVFATAGNQWPWIQGMEPFNDVGPMENNIDAEQRKGARDGDGGGN